LADEGGGVGGLNIYPQSTSPGTDLEANRLLVLHAPFYCWPRTCWPKEAILDGQWMPTAVEPQS
jgi:hypothetical protein